MEDILIDISVEKDTYKICLTMEDVGGFSVFVPTLPGCFTQGETIEECVRMATEAISLYLENQ